ncbi:L-serine ammonia-lyase [Corynebacterium sp. 335C]
MAISALDMFSVGIGPSSSHTVGPMRAAAAFAAAAPEGTVRVDVMLHGSLAATGRGHGTDRAVVLGLAGHSPDTVAPDEHPAPGLPVPPEGTAGRLRYRLGFDIAALPSHPNGMVFTALGGDGEVLKEEDWYSVGGGFILPGEALQGAQPGPGAAAAGREAELPHPFSTARELLERCDGAGLTVAEVMLANETALHGGEEAVVAHLDRVWRVMRECVAAGAGARGILPGGLGVERRASALRDSLAASAGRRGTDPLHAMEWVNLYALAVNEENAAGGRVVTAPTNGAAGIIPAVMHFALDFEEGFDGEAARTFLLTAGAVGIIIKRNASISGAEVGCQGEVGSACAMAAAGLCAFLGGKPWQVERAAEIGLEHNLGLTCDPVGGLVQVPCIERNAMAAVKAINAARLAMHSTGAHVVSLDDAVRTMAETGRDMLDKYKETAAGGLAVNLTEC